jgi:hypothetical protein
VTSFSEDGVLVHAANGYATINPNPTLTATLSAFFKEFPLGGGGAKQEKGRTKNMSRRGLANARDLTLNNNFNSL